MTRVRACSVRVQTTAAMRLDPQRPEYHRASVAWDDASGRLLALSTGAQRSSRLLSMRSANALLELPQADGTLPAGSDIRALLIGEVHRPPRPPRPRDKTRHRCLGLRAPSVTRAGRTPQQVSLGENVRSHLALPTAPPAAAPPAAAPPFTYTGATHHHPHYTRVRLNLLPPLHTRPFEPFAPAPHASGRPSAPG